MVEFKIVNSSDIDIIEEIETIRRKAFGISEEIPVFIHNLTSGNMIAVEAVLDGVAIGGAYVYISRLTRSLNIDRIFIDEEYRNHNYASQLLEYIIQQKDYFEHYYDMEVDKSFVEPISDELFAFYQKNGYRSPNSLGQMVRVINIDKTIKHR